MTIFCALNLDSSASNWTSFSFAAGEMKTFFDARSVNIKYSHSLALEEELVWQWMHRCENLLFCLCQDFLGNKESWWCLHYLLVIFTACKKYWCLSNDAHWRKFLCVSKQALLFSLVKHQVTREKIRKISPQNTPWLSIFHRVIFSKGVLFENVSPGPFSTVKYWEIHGRFYKLTRTFSKSTV